MRKKVFILLALFLFSLSAYAEEITLEELLEKAKSGNSTAQIYLGMYYARSNKTEDSLKTVKWYERAAKQNHIEAQLVLGRLYSSEDSIFYDPKIADKWITRPAENGLPEALFVKAMLCFNDNKYQEAEKWHLKAAEKNLPNSAVQLGMMYYFPQMLGPDYIKSYAWLKLAKSFKKSEITQKGRGMAENYFSKVKEKLSPKQLQKAEKLFERLKTSKKP